jgi:tetrahydromethanopterin S-methyltransferase subunit A
MAVSIESTNVHDPIQTVNNSVQQHDTFTDDEMVVLPVMEENDDEEAEIEVVVPVQEELVSGAIEVNSTSRLDKTSLCQQYGWLYILTIIVLLSIGGTCAMGGCTQ